MQCHSEPEQSLVALHDEKASTGFVETHDAKSVISSMNSFVLGLFLESFVIVGVIRLLTAAKAGTP